ncbi:SOS response-associated peptidase [Paraburkholderia saeva]|uniref:SOS response-associated peptidase n=1 Tax=Paraburkholderia saeva TaxID=2777537 RepID=UPI001D7C6D45|nr:SOS response-associated peptidase family protein [Paraburkholderia saeva]CAG4910247.1 SOS response-associated protein YedK [Paraburkholderia saeva]CAG4928334.1 SOS response-associated protein YedK [Paraburkholderia saeva]
MCNRISQYSQPLRYAGHLGLANPVMLFDAADRRLGYNVGPGMHPLAIYPDESVRAIHWGYRPPWAVAENLPQTINARAETAATARYFRTLWRTGRVLVPADGWFEWRVEAATETGAPDTSPTSRDIKERQPWYVRLKRDEPMYIAALSSVGETGRQTEGMGMVLVTATADAGLIDVHDRRPLVLAPQAARRWLDPSLPLRELELLARKDCVPASEFAWYRVGGDVNRLLADEPGLIEALA